MVESVAVVGLCAAGCLSGCEITPETVVCWSDSISDRDGSYYVVCLDSACYDVPRFEFTRADGVLIYHAVRYVAPLKRFSVGAPGSAVNLRIRACGPSGCGSWAEISGFWSDGYLWPSGFG